MKTLIMAVENNCIGNNYIKTKIGKIKTNSRCRLCAEKNGGKVIHMKSYSSKNLQRNIKNRNENNMAKKQKKVLHRPNFRACVSDITTDYRIWWEVENGRDKFELGKENQPL